MGYTGGSGHPISAGVQVGRVLGPTMVHRSFSEGAGFEGPDVFSRLRLDESRAGLGHLAGAWALGSGSPEGGGHPGCMTGVCWDRGGSGPQISLRAGSVPAQTGSAEPGEALACSQEPTDPDMEKGTKHDEELTPPKVRSVTGSPDKMPFMPGWQGLLGLQREPG